MGLVTGTTQHRLDVVKTYDSSNPYIVGVNGVTAINTDVNGIKTVEYTIDGIKYKTRLIKYFNNPKISGTDVNNPIGKSYLPNREQTTLDVVYPTTFEYTTQPLTGQTTYFVFKDEAKMGVVFTPKVYEDVFIERQKMNVYEIHSRLSEINTLGDLIDYNNGFYNIVKTE
tara:strand:+ start:351 stop:860 length:510 start_codon:yes stop_codon:yes gene_type:complete